MAGARLSYDLVVLGDGALARLAGCLVAKSGKRVLRLRRTEEPEPALPPFPPLDLTLLPAVRETALKLGILVPLRDRLRPQYSLGHFCSEQGSAELFLERAARDHQQQRLTHETFDHWCRILAKPMEDPVPIEYPLMFHRGWWKRWRNRKGWTEVDLGSVDAQLDALSRPYFLHPWTGIDETEANLRWSGQRDLHALDRPLHSFIELAEARSGVEVLPRDRAVDYDLNRGRLVSVITARGQHIGGTMVLWADPIDQFNILGEKAQAKIQNRWDKDGALHTEVKRIYGRLAAVDWPPFLSRAILIANGNLQLSVESRGHEIHIETWLRANEDLEAINLFFERHFPLLRRNPLTQSETLSFVRRAEPKRLPPKLDTGLGGVYLVPDRLIHGLGIDAPFAMAQQLADRVIGP